MCLSTTVFNKSVLKNQLDVVRKQCFELVCKTHFRDTDTIDWVLVNNTPSNALCLTTKIDLWNSKLTKMNLTVDAGSQKLILLLPRILAPSTLIH